LLSSYYLTTLFPDAPVLLYPDSVDASDAKERWKTARIAFGLPHQLASVPRGTVDAFINIYSFMEMSPAQVATYFDAIEAASPRVLFIKQHKHEVNLFES